MASITDQSPGVIIKSDRSGRTRYTSQYKREVLAAFESSSLSAPAFARQCGIRYPTFAAWVGKRKRGSNSHTRKSPAFLIAEVAPAGETAGLEVILPGGGIARISAPDQIAVLVLLLRQLA